MSKPAKRIIQDRLRDLGKSQTEFAKELGVTPASLSRTLGSDIVRGNSNWPNILKALGLKVAIIPNTTVVQTWLGDTDPRPNHVPRPTQEVSPQTTKLQTAYFRQQDQKLWKEIETATKGGKRAEIERIADLSPREFVLWAKQHVGNHSDSVLSKYTLIDVDKPKHKLNPIEQKRLKRIPEIQRLIRHLCNIHTQN